MVSNMVPSASHPVWPLPSFSFLFFFRGGVWGKLLGPSEREVCVPLGVSHVG